MKYLKKTDFTLINKMTVEQHGGNFVGPNNFLHENALDYLVEAAEGEMFGNKLYPTFAAVAALYFHSVISNHIFQDGNKRTGLASAVLFLKLNGYNLRHVEIGKPFASRYYFTMIVADGRYQLLECQSWFEENIIPL